MTNRIAAASLVVVSLIPVAARAGADPDRDPLPAGAIARLGSARWSAGACNYLEFAADGKSLYTSNLNFGSMVRSDAERDVVRQWDRANGKESQRWLVPLHKERRCIFAVNAARDRVVTYRRDNVLEVMSLRRGTVLFSVHAQGLDTAALSPDGRHLAAWEPYSNVVTVWDVDKQRKRWTFSAAPTAANARGDPMARLLFSPNGKMLALRVRRYGANFERFSAVRLWETNEGKERLHETINGNTNPDIAFSPDSATFAWSHAKGITLRDVQKKADDRLLETDFAASPYSTPHMAFSPNGRDLAVANAGKVAVWNLASAQAQVLTPCVQFLDCIAFSPDGTELVGAVTGSGNRGADSS